MARGIMLDSSVVIPHLRGQMDLAARVSAADQLFLSLIAFGELQKGIFRSSRPEESRRRVDHLFQIVAVLSTDLGTAVRYGELSAALYQKGTPIPENDIWIAAMAIDCDMPLATRDAHFEKVPSLQILNW
jgi:tRNA(fMet)-specific endonuclease VapC